MRVGFCKFRPRARPNWKNFVSSSLYCLEVLAATALDSRKVMPSSAKVRFADALALRLTRLSKPFFLELGRCSIKVSLVDELGLSFRSRPRFTAGVGLSKLVVPRLKAILERGVVSSAFKLSTFWPFQTNWS